MIIREDLWLRSLSNILTETDLACDGESGGLIPNRGDNDAF